MRTPVVLFRPVGPVELDLITEAAMRTFPPRLDWQPIFYPVLNVEYAIQIARDWNTKDDETGYVTRFAVDAEFLALHEVHQVGAQVHLEYWIPAEDLVAFNDHLIGPIEVIAAYRGDPPRFDQPALLNARTAAGLDRQEAVVAALADEALAVARTDA